jgi:hypothetical protein
VGQPSRFAVRVTASRFVLSMRVVKTSAKGRGARGLAVASESVAKTIEVPSGENDPART